MSTRSPSMACAPQAESGLHVMRLGVFPQVFPVMMSHVLYFFEIQCPFGHHPRHRGGRGIGLQLSDRMRINNWQEAAFIILMILVTVADRQPVATHPHEAHPKRGPGPTRLAEFHRRPCRTAPNAQA